MERRRGDCQRKRKPKDEKQKFGHESRAVPRRLA
jgi:hypothetical protein